MNPATQPRRGLPVALYPTGLLLASVLSVYVSFSISPYSAVRALVIAVAAGVALTVATTALTRDRDRGALVAGMGAIVLLGGAQPLILAPLLAISVIVTWDARRPPERRFRIRWHFVTRALGAVVGILILALGIKGLQDGRIVDTAYDLMQETRAPWVSGAPDRAVTGELPNIYMILLDGYLRPDKQAELFGGDASGFIADLGARGFDVAGHSRSNYIITRLSLASMMNMELVQTLVEGDRRGGRGRFDPRYLVNESEVIGAVRAAGYEVVGFAGAWEGLSLRQADRFTDPALINELEFQVLARSALRPILNAVAPDLVADAWRARIEKTFESVADVASQPASRPRFVFAHIPSPHSPFVYGPDGESLPGFPMERIHLEAPPGELDPADYGSIYTGQARHLGILTIQTVDEILDADPDAVIVVFSDHGSGSGYRPDDYPMTDMDERTANLVAVRTPGHPRLLPDRTTLVNVLGPILNAYLGTDYAVAPDDVFGLGSQDELDMVLAEGMPP